MRRLFIILFACAVCTSSLYAQEKQSNKSEPDSAKTALIAKVKALQNQMLQIQDSVNKFRSVNVLRDVGYGYQKAGNITGSVSSVTTDELQKGGYSNIYQYLQGRVPGMTVTQDPASSSGYTIRIRGVNSFYGSSEPLIVLNGTPLSGASDIQYLNPHDVKSIDVLKDAASASIYGVRGANGVILIRTK